MNIHKVAASAYLGSLIILSGCSTTSGVMVNPSAPTATYQSVYIVTHGGSSSDMDANMQREFLRHGMSVTIGAEGGASPEVQIIARYTDEWK